MSSLFGTIALVRVVLLALEVWKWNCGPLMLVVVYLYCVHVLNLKLRFTVAAIFVKESAWGSEAKLSRIF